MTDERLIESQVVTLGQALDSLFSSALLAAQAPTKKAYRDAAKVRKQAAGNVARALHNLMRSESRIHTEGLSAEIGDVQLAVQRL